MLSALRSGKKPGYVAFSMSSSVLLALSPVKSSTHYSPLTRKPYTQFYTSFRDCLWACSFHFSSRFEVAASCHFRLWLARRQPDELYSLMPQFLLVIHHSLEVVFKSRIFRRYLALDSPDLLETFVVSHFGCHAQPPSSTSTARLSNLTHEIVQLPHGTPTLYQIATGYGTIFAGNAPKAFPLQKRSQAAS